VKKNVIFFCLICIILLFAARCGFAAPADWKWERPVELVCPFGAGGGTDTSLRAIQPFLEKELGVSVIINNRPGSSALVGSEFFISQPADGYSYLMVTTSQVVHEIVGDMSFKVLEACEPLCILNKDDYVLVAREKASYNDLLELRDYAKDKPGDVKVACISMGGTDEFVLNNLMSELDVTFTLVPYSSGAEQIAALLGGFVDMIVVAASEISAYIESGDMKALGILGQTRNNILPDVKSCKDMGLKMDFVIFRGMVGKKGIPEGALQSIRTAFAKAVEAQGWKDWLAANGLKLDGFGTPDEFTKAYSDRLEAVKIGMSMSSLNK
jgi:tripartite-type tricarboxylate transporter receptor subunit TctC